MTYADNYNIRTTSVKFNDVADAIDGSITRPFGGTTTGTNTAYIASPSPAWTAYDTASFITIIPHVTNAAGPVTLNVSGLGTKTIKRGGNDLVAGVLVQNIPTILIYTGVYFDVIAAANALLLDGSSTMLGNINFGGFRPHNVAAGSATNASYYGSTDATTGIFFPGSSAFCITAGGAERLRVNNSGLIGIGTTSPGFTLDVQSTTANLVATRFSADASPSQLILRKSRSATVGANTLVSLNDSLGGIYFQGANGTGYTDAAGIVAEIDGTPGASNDMPTRLRFLTTADGSGTLTERMRIDNAGNVGIGTTSPGENLHIKSSAPRIRFEDTDSGGAYSTITGNSSSGSITIQADVTNASANSTIGFDVDNSQKMNLDGSGRLAINTTQVSGYNLTVGGSIITTASTNGDSGSYILNSNSGTSARATVLFGNNASPYASINLNSSTYTGGYGNANDLTFINSAADGRMEFLTAPSAGGAPVSRMSIENDGAKGFSNGNVILSSTAIGSGAGSHFVKWSNSTGILTYDTSSIRYKENVEAIPYGLTEALQLSPKKFAYKSDGSIGIGFIAEDVQTVIPEVVSLNNNNQPDAISYDRLTAVLCKAIQELTARVVSLEGSM